MAQAGNTELVDAFEQFFRNYYDNEIKQLAQRYPNEQRSLSIDWQDLYRFDPDLADDFNQPEQLQRYAEEALRLYDLPIDVSLGKPTFEFKTFQGPNRRRSGDPRPQHELPRSGSWHRSQGDRRQTQNRGGRLRVSALWDAQPDTTVERRLSGTPRVPGL